MPDDEKKIPCQGRPLNDDDFEIFASDITQKIAEELKLKTS